MSQDPLTVEHDGAVAILTFNRPEVLNAFNNALMERTLETVAALNDDESVRVIVMRGSGRAFSPGFDLKASAERKMEGVQDWERQMQLQFNFIMQFWHSPKPTIAAVHGYCIAGAFELALACDVTIAAENTRFGEPEVRFGTGIVAMLLPWVTGPKQAKEILLTGEDQLSAADALRMGIVNRVVADDAVFSEAMAVAKSMATAAERSVRFTKRAINEIQPGTSLVARPRRPAQCRLRPGEGRVQPYPPRTRRRCRHRLARRTVSGLTLSISVIPGRPKRIPDSGADR
jgi:enoyl-CoA hydratase